MARVSQILLLFVFAVVVECEINDYAGQNPVVSPSAGGNPSNYDYYPSNRYKPSHHGREMSRHELRYLLSLISGLKSIVPRPGHQHHHHTPDYRKNVPLMREREKIDGNDAPVLRAEQIGKAVNTINNSSGEDDFLNNDKSSNNEISDQRVPTGKPAKDVDITPGDIGNVPDDIEVNVSGLPIIIPPNSGAISIPDTKPSTNDITKPGLHDTGDETDANKSGNPVTGAENNEVHDEPSILDINGHIDLPNPGVIVDVNGNGEDEVTPVVNIEQPSEDKSTKNHTNLSDVLVPRPEPQPGGILIPNPKPHPGEILVPYPKPHPGGTFIPQIRPNIGDNLVTRPQKPIINVKPIKNGAYFIININGHPILIKNPGLTVPSDGNIDLNTLSDEELDALIGSGIQINKFPGIINTGISNLVNWPNWIQGDRMPGVIPINPVTPGGSVVVSGLFPDLGIGQPQIPQPELPGPSVVELPSGYPITYPWTNPSYPKVNVTQPVFVMPPQNPIQYPRNPGLQRPIFVVPYPSELPQIPQQPPVEQPPVQPTYPQYPYPYPWYPSQLQYPVPEPYPEQSIYPGFRQPQPPYYPPPVEQPVQPGQPTEHPTQPRIRQPLYPVEPPYESTEPTVQPAQPPTKLPKQPNKPSQPPVESPYQPTESPQLPVEPPHQPTESPVELPQPPLQTPKPPMPPSQPPQPSQPPVQPPYQPTQAPQPPVESLYQPTQPSQPPVEPPYQPAQPIQPPVQPPYQPTQPPRPPVEPPYQPAEPTQPPVQPPYQPTQSPQPPVQPPYQPVQPAQPPVQPPYQPTQPLQPPVEPPYQRSQPPAQPSQLPIEPPVQPPINLPQPPIVKPEKSKQPDITTSHDMQKPISPGVDIIPPGEPGQKPIIPGNINPPQQPGEIPVSPGADIIPPPYPGQKPVIPGADIGPPTELPQKPVLPGNIIPPQQPGEKPISLGADLIPPPYPGKSISPGVNIILPDGSGVEGGHYIPRPNYPHLHPTLRPGHYKPGKGLIELINKILNLKPPHEKPSLSVPDLIAIINELKIGNSGSGTTPAPSVGLNVAVQPEVTEDEQSNLLMLLSLLTSNSQNVNYPNVVYYPVMNPGNPLLYFLGHFPCDHPSYSGISGLKSLLNLNGQSLQNLNLQSLQSLNLPANVWQVYLNLVKSMTNQAGAEGTVKVTSTSNSLPVSVKKF